MTYLSIPETITIKQTSKIKPNSKTFSLQKDLYDQRFLWYTDGSNSFQTPSQFNPLVIVRQHKTNELSSQCIVIRNRITHNGLLRQSSVSKIYTNIHHLLTSSSHRNLNFPFIHTLST